MVLGDFHIHSNFSDGQLTIPELIDFYGERGFGAIAITDHLCETKTFLGKTAHLLSKSLHKKTFSDYLHIIKQEAKRAWKNYKMTVIPGVEITKNSFAHKDSAHILCLGISHYIDPDLSIEEICNITRDQNGITVAAHPVSTRRLEPQTYFLWNNRERLKTHFDCWEVASGPVLFDEVMSSGFPMLANSDLHRPSQINSWKTVVYSEPNPREILTEIKKQKIDFSFYKESEYAEQRTGLPKITNKPSVIFQPY